MVRQPALSDWLLMGLLSVVWGSSFILIEKGVAHIAPVQVGGLRIFIAALILLPLVGKRWLALSGSERKYIALQSLTGNFIPAFLFPIAQMQLDSAHAGILNAMAPAWVWMWGLVLFGLTYRFIHLLGVAIAFSGVVVLVGNLQDLAMTKSAWLLVVATSCYGLSANLVRARLQQLSPITITSVGFVMMAIPALLVLWASHYIHPLHLTPEVWTSLGFVTLLAVGGSVLASAAFYFVVQRTSPLFGTSVTFLMPVVAMGWGLLAKEHITAADGLALLLILTGIYLLSRW